MILRSSTLNEILHSKEERVQRQHYLLERFAGSSLISLTINMPGAIKISPEALAIFDIAEASIIKECNPRYSEKKMTCAGVEAFFVCQKEAVALKALTCKIEMEDPLGRFMDIDVLNPDKEVLSRTALGFAKRKCYICDNEAFVCARAQVHSLAELQTHIIKSVKEHALMEYLTHLAYVAMRKEVELTPKPGLVDSANSGAHKDMNIHTFYRSIDAIVPFVRKYIQGAYTIHYQEPQQIFQALRQIGISCDTAMLRASKGINTHKGMVFCLAVVCGALGVMKAKKEPFTCEALHVNIKTLCAHVVERDLIAAKPHTAGARFFYETGSLGIRGEAQAGFPRLFDVSLPFFRLQKEQFGEEIALKKTLLLLMSTLEDSTLWSRGGIEGLNYVKEKASQYLFDIENNPTILNESLRLFDEDLIQKNLSPGGSADMLALTWLVSECMEL
ncbi:MAG: triphosphoribosyl-dephospho-CoA synthase CitG [Sulfurospirillaceae bacterium]|nr:triphosphoribosyl-dephospho-CoA synthase CitG [Sulfurospirillaceae bacterium]MDD2827911.1 triphosphoribosyl-dephospho-CoA synthase CitG [Sulfurospirillaceae bacterium]